MDYTANHPQQLAPLHLVYGDVTLGIHGGRQAEEFHYLFSYAANGMESLVSGNIEWLYRPPRPCFWRALTDNDRGNDFALKSGMWLAADQFIRCKNITIAVDGQTIPFPSAPENNQYTGQETASVVSITYTYQTITIPSAQVDVCYQIHSSGDIYVNLYYHGRAGLPPFPVLGLRFLMPTCADGFVYQGLSGETYPDRKAGGIHGIYQIERLPVTPYLVPQDCGTHMDTTWVKIQRSRTLDSRNSSTQTASLQFMAEGDSTFAFSCLPYTAAELENATHQEELPPPRRTVLSIYAAVRGVGGIDSWGSEVEPAYHTDATKDISFGFHILPATSGQIIF